MVRLQAIADQYGLDKKDFSSFIMDNLLTHPAVKVGVTGIGIDPNAVQQIVQIYQGKLKLMDQEAEQRKKAEIEKQRALSEILITSGFTFDGYEIVKYSGYISGDDAIQVARGREGLFSRATDVGESLMDSLTKIRRRALTELKEAAYDLGCNAVIGVDFDYITLEPETANAGGGTLYLPYVFGVTANGNAVIIRKLQQEVNSRQVCPNCGYNISAQSNYCTNCGCRLR